MKIAIIGAGLSALTLATKLQNNVEIEIFEKSRGVGGRMATRFAKPFYFDHGAQHFVVKTKEFAEFLEPLKKANIVAEWHANFAELDFDKVLFQRKWCEEGNMNHYVGIPKMNAVVKYLANNLENNVKINLETKIIHANRFGDKWQLKDDKGKIFRDFDFVFFTTPPLQALEILPQELDICNVIKKYKMQGCYSLMLALAKKPDFAYDAALIKNAKISWISFNSSKPQRVLGEDEDGNKHFCYLINSTNKWAEENIESDQEWVKKELIEEAQKIIKFDDEDLIYSNIHRWRYANIEKQNGEKSLFDSKEKIGVCGDWLIQGRVESAFLSAADLLSKLN